MRIKSIFLFNTLQERKNTQNAAWKEACSIKAAINCEQGHTLNIYSRQIIELFDVQRDKL